MKSYKQILEKKGDSLINLYQQALINADRYATGKTNNSFRFEVKEENSKVKFIIYSADHVRDLETGQTAEVWNAKAGFNIFQQIEDWAIAKGVNKSTSGIIASLRLKGFEGTPNLITDVDKDVVNIVLEEVKKGSKSIILEQIKTSTNGNIDN